MPGKKGSVRLPRGEKSKRVKRKCLNCDAEFIAPSRYRRLCSHCWERIADYHVQDDAGVGRK